MPNLPRAAAALALLAVTTALMAPAALEGSPVGHDSRLHLVWVREFADSLAAGIAYPRWLPDVNAGLGNPTFVFYPPLVYYLAAPFVWLTGSAPRALDVVAALACLVSAAAAYRYLRGGLPRGAALVGALALVALPYRLLDYYERAAIAEYVAFVWPPLALLAIRRLARVKSWREAGPPAAALAVCTAGLALTHLPTLVVWGPLLAAAVVWADGRPGGVARGWIALGLGLALAGVFLVPAYAERPLVQLEWLDWVAKPENHTLFARGMPHESQMIAFNHKVSRLVCWTAALAGVAALAALWPGGGRPWRTDGARLPVAAAALVAAAVFVLMTGASRSLWTVLPVLPAIQFPWRLAVVLTPLAALLVACATARTFAPGASWPARVLGAGAAALLAANVAVGVRDVVAKAFLDPVWAARIADNVGSAQDAAEYRPRAAPATGFPRLPRALVTPGGRIAVRAWDPERRVIELETGEPARLRVATFHYAGWRATVDGRAWPIETGEYGTMTLDLPAGRHVVELRFGSTWDRTAGAATSGIALALTGGWFVWGLAGRRRREK
ncbi:MAG TPA: 6-pyruvoyl-tetrahydropterin synthase-related protein [Thermodesulfobacteriota bacterium]